MLTFTVTGIDGAVAEFSALPLRVRTATVRSLNRAINTTQTFMSRAVSKDTGLKVGDVKKAFTLRQASAQQPVASVRADLKRLPLMQFGAKPGRKGVSYVMRGTRKTIVSSFIATMHSGHQGVFLRIGKKRLPIRELMGPSLGQVFSNYQAEGQQTARDAFAKNFDHEFAFAGTSNG